MITIKSTGVDDALAQLRDYPAKLQAAQKILIEKATQFAAEKMLQQMALAHSIPEAVLIRHRRIASSFGVVWVGYNPLPAGETGNPVKTTKGVYINGHHYDHAFIIRTAMGLAVYARESHGKGAGASPLHQVMMPLDQTQAVAYRVGEMTGAYLGSIALDTIRGVQ